MAQYNFDDEAEKANKQLAGDLAKRSPLTEAEIQNLLPKKVDKENFERLLKIVNSATTDNQKLAALRENLEGLGGVALKILGRFLTP